MYSGGGNSRGNLFRPAALSAGDTGSGFLFRFHRLQTGSNAGKLFRNAEHDAAGMIPPCAPLRNADRRTVKTADARDCQQRTKVSWGLFHWLLSFQGPGGPLTAAPGLLSFLILLRLWIDSNFFCRPSSSAGADTLDSNVPAVNQNFQTGFHIIC